MKENNIQGWQCFKLESLPSQWDGTSMSPKNSNWNTAGSNVCGQHMWTEYKLITSARWLLCTHMLEGPANIEIKALYWSEDLFFFLNVFIFHSRMAGSSSPVFLARLPWIWKTHFTKQLDRIQHKSMYYLLVPRALNSAVAQLPTGLSESPAQLQPAFEAAKVSICILSSVTCGWPPLKRSQCSR